MYKEKNIEMVNLFEDAIRFAVKKHKGQRRKGDGRPYIMHPISVMTHIQGIKKSTNVYLLGTAAILHDVVEDCGVKIEKIAKKFGFAVAALVEELTLDKSKYETIGKTRYLCQEVLKMSSYALAIKLCDRLDNVRDLATMPDEFVRKYVVETHQILDTLMADRPKLTKTHFTLIEMIEVELKKY